MILSEKVYRCYVEKREGFDIAAKKVSAELAEALDTKDITLRVFNRYDIQNLPQERWQDIINAVLSEPMCDRYFEEELPSFSEGVRLLFVEPLPGQFDLRADSCAQCIQMLLGGTRPVVRTATVYAIEGVEGDKWEMVKDWLINPLESREAATDKPKTLSESTRIPEDVPIVSGFIQLSDEGLESLREQLGLAMSMEDIALVQSYFKSEGRDPSLTELRVIDTYWSDHCRHTTFNTIIETADIKDKRVAKAYSEFLEINGEKPPTLMRMATAAMRYLRSRGELPMLDESEENNACTIRIKVEFENAETEDWLLFFKNETHNHPTEIEPFGGASTCIGGAIRDPLSGRAYVYQAMRITGAGDPTKPIKDTLVGKIPHRKLTVTAAEGYSSYGNQIGLATGYVKEFYHEGYIAKRLEVGAVVGAAKAEYVRRETPASGDVIVLLGGRTGRDGIGGATGSSKTHGTNTAQESAAEVQKGNAPEERKLQRLFRNPDVTKLIKKCNDFGAGGVCVAIGELADGVLINLDTVPTKYDGLNGTEIATSESQERMAVVINSKDLQELLKHAEAENVEATAVAEVTDNNRMTMTWRDNVIVDIARAFLDTNGAERYAKVYVPALEYGDDSSIGHSELSKEKLLQIARDLNFCSQKGLVERFDSSIGASSVFMPFGGKYALSESQVMAALLPKTGAVTASVMASGFDPHFTEKDPFGGAAYAVVTSVAKLIASGVKIDTIHLSLQEYFPRLKDDPARWGLPFAAMLGAFSAKMGLKIAAIGGKDSMSGSFGDLDVPPTLISFAAGVNHAAKMVSSEFKRDGNPVYLLETPMDKDGLPDYAALLPAWDKYARLCNEGKVLSAWACESGGIYGGIMKMALGNKLGFEGISYDDLAARQWGSIIFEANCELEGYKLLGYTDAEGTPLRFGKVSLELSELIDMWELPLESVFSTAVEQVKDIPIIADERRPSPYIGTKFAKPKAIIPVFPGTNCEYDTAAAIERAGGIGEIVQIRNLTPDMLKSSILELEKAIKSAQIIVFPGGFSGGDEPDGSGKFIVSLLRNPSLTDAVHDLLENKDGLILGICNGFQALVKLGLLPYGKISDMTADCPTLTYNSIGRHQAKYVQTRVASTLSPWLSGCNVGEIYTQPISHGEGRFVANDEILARLKASGQIAFQYLDNPNGSVWNIEAITSPCGRVLGKMAHTERWGKYVAQNIYGDTFIPIFESGIKYFK